MKTTAEGAFPRWTCIVSLVVILAAASRGGAEQTDEQPLQATNTQLKDWTFQPIASLANYALYESHPFFGDEERHWMETSMIFGGKLQWRTFAVELSGIGVKTTGRDPYGTPRGLAPDFDFNTAYVQFLPTDDWPVRVTLGRQPITVGTQFLVGDGVYDGFHNDFRQAVYHNPRRNFDALRLEADLAKTHFDAFIYRVSPTWDGGGQWNGTFGGLDMSHTFEPIKGTYAVGLFYRDSPSDLDNDMAVVNVRAEQHWPKIDDLYVSGEWVGEFGTGRNAAYVTTVGESLHENAWHAEIGYQANHTRFKPFAEAGYVYYSRDFTPIATGFTDWGKWYLGNEIDWIIFGTDSKVVRGQVGFWPHPKVKVRAQYHHTDLVSRPDGPLSDEFSLITEWYPNKHLWVNLLLGYSMAGSGLKKSGLTNPFSALNPDAVSIGTHDSFLAVLAFGVSY